MTSSMAWQLACPLSTKLELKNDATELSQVAFWFINSLQMKLLRQDEIIPSGHRTTAMSKHESLTCELGR